MLWACNDMYQYYTLTTEKAWVHYAGIISVIIGISKLKMENFQESKVNVEQ